MDKDKDTHRKYVFYQFTILVKIWLISRVILRFQLVTLLKLEKVDLVYCFISCLFPSFLFLIYFLFLFIALAKKVI